MSFLRTLLILGRVSNLPTVWSNCLAAWLICGGGSVGRFLWVCMGGTLLYVSGMFLNDAFDAGFDRRHKQDRPIAAGHISMPAVWAWGLALMLAGLAVLWGLGSNTAMFASLLAGNILFYDAVHKRTTWSPVLMAGCRVFLVLAAASAADHGVNGLAVWTAAVLACYIIGLSYIARFESVAGPLRYWPCVMLAAPLVLAWIVDVGDWRLRGIIFSLLLSVWVMRSLQFTFIPAKRNLGRTVSGLLAGIVLVDLLAVAGGSFGTILAFLALFGLALLFQRHIPAT